MCFSLERQRLDGAPPVVIALVMWRLADRSVDASDTETYVIGPSIASLDQPLGAV